MRVVALGFALVAFAWSGRAQAIEREWHVAAIGGWAHADFPLPVAFHENATVLPIEGFAAGALLSYGLNDAVNLRVHVDLTSYPSAVVFGEPDAYEQFDALAWNAALGAEYVIDILDWVPYVGVVAGPVDVLVEHQPHDLHLGVEIPVGLGYTLGDFTLGVEGRYRLLMFGSGLAPPSSFALFARAEYLFGR